MLITPRQALQKLIEHQDLSHAEMLAIMQQMMLGELTSAQIGGLLMGLRVKGESVDEIAAAAQVMREFASQVTVADNTHLIDTCGTGGALNKAFNVSTCSAFVAAGAGVGIAKHGNRAASSKTGSADVLEALGVNISLSAEQVGHCIDRIGIGFMFAPNHHSATKHAAPVRKELGVRTLFNLLGPLTNPAGAKRQIMGVFHRDLTGLLVRVLQRLGSEHVMVVHSADGMDEISFAGETYVAELLHGQVHEYVLTPENFGLPRHSVDSIAVQNAQESKQIILDVLGGKQHTEQQAAARDIVLLNAGAAIYVAGLAESLSQGVMVAAASIDTGAAQKKLIDLVSMSMKMSVPA